MTTVGTLQLTAGARKWNEHLSCERVTLTIGDFTVVSISKVIWQLLNNIAEEQEEEEEDSQSCIWADHRWDKFLSDASYTPLQWPRHSTGIDN